MSTITLDRTGFLANVLLAQKGPCRVATTANITLEGEQTIDGVAVVAEDRVLVKDQTDGLNGIMICKTGDWEFADDFDQRGHADRGSFVIVTNGTANAMTMWVMTTTGDPVPGREAIDFTQFFGGAQPFQDFETRADAVAASIPSSIDWIRTHGYTTVNDLGGGNYKRASSEPSHPGKFQSANGTWWELDEEFPNPHQFGAKGDYNYNTNTGTNDTTAFENCRDYAYTRKCIVHLFHKAYMLSTFTVGDTEANHASSHKAITWRGVSYDSRPNQHLSATLVLAPSTNANLIYQDLGGPAPIWERIIFDGNKTQQSSGTSFCYQLGDATPDPGEFFYGAQFYQCAWIYGRSGGLYVGRNRGAGVVEDCEAFECGSSSTGHGVVLDSFDWVVRGLHSGGCEGFGLKIDHAAQIQMSAVNLYLNGEGGLQITAECTDVTLHGGSIDRNEKRGVQIANGTNATYNGERVIAGVRFLGNGSATDNTYSDVECIDAVDDLALVSCDFQGYEDVSERIKYFFDFTSTSARIRIPGCRFGGSAGTGFSNADCFITEQYQNTIEESALAGLSTRLVTRASADATGASYVGRKARGSLSSPSAAQSGDDLLVLGARGYGQSAFASSDLAALRFIAAENWSDSAQGTHIAVETTPTGSTTRAERARVTAAGEAVVGHTAAVAVASFTPRLQTHGTSAGPATNAAFRWSADGSGPRFAGVKSRNATVGSHTVLQSGDAVVNFEGYASDGASFIAAAGIAVVIDGTAGSSSIPGRLVFSTNNSGTGITEAMRIDSKHNVIAPNNAAALSTSATDGLIYIPTSTGGSTSAPIGTPTSYTGMVPMIYDTGSNRLWLYNGAWRSVALSS